MKRVIALIVGALWVLTATVLPAQASYTGTVPSTYTDSGGAQNASCDSGRPVSNCKSNQAVISFLNGVPCPKTGQKPYQVRASVYSVTVPEVYSAYKRVIECGVDVELVYAEQHDEDGNDLGLSQWMDKLVKLKGPHTKIKRVRASGMASGSSGTQHIKVVTRNTDNGVLSGSNNTSYAGDRDGWGGWFQISDKKIHDNSVHLIEAAMKDKSQSACKYSGTGSDSRRAMYYEPCSYDPVLAIMKSVHAGSGCVWYYQMFMVTSYAKPKIKELERLGREGCKVYVLVNKGGTWTDSFMRELSKAKNVEVNDASYNPKHPSDHVYNHAKRNAAKGLKKAGKNYSFVSDGSATDTSSGYKYSVNNLLVSTVPEEVQAGLNWSALAHADSRRLPYSVLCANKKLSGC